MKRLKKLAISVGCRFFIAMCLCMFAGVDIIYAQHADSDSITEKVHQIPDVTVSGKKTMIKYLQLFPYNVWEKT